MTWRLFTRRPAADPVPPCPEPYEPCYLQWVARYDPLPVIRLAAMKALAAADERARREQRLRDIVREELRQALAEHSGRRPAGW